MLWTFWPKTVTKIFSDLLQKNDIISPNIPNIKAVARVFFFLTKMGILVKKKTYQKKKYVTSKYRETCNTSIL